MKLFIQFDASVSGYEVKNEVSAISSWEGIKSLQLLEKVSGDSPRFCVEVDVSDEQAQAVRDRVRGLQGQYSGYVYNMRELAYRPA